MKVSSMNTNLKRKRQSKTQSKNGVSSKVKLPVPVTLLSGFLGSGKTTLVKKILGNTVGMKVLVIENEIGAEGIDHELLMQHTAKEEIILMNNGCVCCTGLFMFLLVFAYAYGWYALYLSYICINMSKYMI